MAASSVVGVATGAATCSTSTAPSSSPFEVLVKPHDPRTEERIRRAQEHGSRTGFWTCAGRAINWAWHAGKVGLAVRVITSTVSACLPYAVAVSAAKITDALVKLPHDPSAANTAIQWFVASGAIGLAMTFNGLLDRWNGNRHQMRLKQVMLDDLRDAVTGFSPAKQLTSEVNQDVGRVLGARWSLAQFGERIVHGCVPVASVVGAVAIVGTYSPAAACALACFVPLHVIHMRRMGAEKVATDFGLSEVYGRFNQREWGMLTGASAVEIALYDKVKQFLEHLRAERIKIDDREREPDLNQLGRDFWLQPLNQITVFSLGAALLVDALYGAGSAPSVGQYGLLAGALITANSSFRALASAIGEVFKELPTMKTALGIMQLAEEERGKEAQQRPEGDQPIHFDKAPSLTVRNLTFAYPANSDQPAHVVLDNISFEIRRGELLGVVGRSGCGKSTLTSLLCGLNEPPPDTMLLDGHCVAQMPRRQLWGNCAYLRQKTSNLYSLTLRENIRLGETSPLSDAEIMRVADETGFGKYMRDNGWSLDTVLGQYHENGVELSGGQGTLLAMTRAAVTGAKLLVLDEPTAALDQELADKTLDRLMKMQGVTRIVISHDFGIAKNTDRILVIDGGKVVDLGTHDELIERCPFYKIGYSAQLNRLRGRSENSENSDTIAGQ